MTAGQAGELGDYLFSLPTILELQARDIFAVERPWTRPGFLNRSKALTRLLETQDYIDTFRQHQWESLDHDLSPYRSIGGRYGDNISSKIARWARVSPDLSRPWLEVDPSPKTAGRIVINRCPRWWGVRFPWRELVKAFQKDLVFIGMEDEYRAFCAQYGSVEYLRTADLLEAAQAIAGSELFIGNQSSCNAICEGLKHPNILEVCATSHDCFYGRASTTYCVTGEIYREILGREFRHMPKLSGYLWTGVVDGTLVQSIEKDQCEVMVRAEYVAKGLSLPSIVEIQASLSQRFQH